MNALVFKPCRLDHAEMSVKLECIGGPCCGQTVLYKSDPIADGMIVWEPDHLACGWYEPVMIWRQDKGNCGVALRWVP